MFEDYVYERSSAPYYNKLLLLDNDEIYRKIDYLRAFSAHGFEIIYYENDLNFRIKHREKIDSEHDKIVILAHNVDYVPYDILVHLHVFEISFQNLFPKLNAEVLSKIDKTELDLLCCTYPSNYDYLQSPTQTERFISEKAYSKETVDFYLRKKMSKLTELVNNAKSYKDWYEIAQEKSRLDLLATQNNMELNIDGINRSFQSYVLKEFGKLSQCIDKDSPVLVSKAMDFMYNHSEKFVIIVMDGMSWFDWRLLSTSFKGIKYEQTSIFAMIPSTTSISRQCLLSNKYPSQLMQPWKQNKEKTEFIDCAKSLGFTNAQIGYERGYEAEFGSYVRCGAVIINDIDNMVHAQTLGKMGMYQDVKLLANQFKLSNMVQRLLSSGFDVYISADHGNTLCKGIGRVTGTGVEVETKSHRMLVLKNFANKETLVHKYRLVEYPKYYLPKDYDYLICNLTESLDNNGEIVMTHGGMTLDEVIVPFIKIKAVENNE